MNRQVRFLRLAMYFIQRRKWRNGMLLEYAAEAIRRSEKYK